MFRHLTRRATGHVASACLLLVLAAPSATAQRIEPSPHADVREMVWPLPPQTPRVRYVGELRSQRSLGRERRSFLGRVKRLLIGSDPQASQAVNRPFDAYVDERNRVYVSNGSLGSLFFFDQETGETGVLAPTGSASLAKPMGLGGDSDGNLYVADPVRRRIVAMTSEGEFVQAYGGHEVLLNPTDVAVSPDGRKVYVADSYLHQIVIFDRQSARLIRRVGRDDGDLVAKADRARSGSMQHAGSIAVDAASHSGESSDLTENRGANDAEFRYPAFVDVGPDGTVYVSDGLNFRIQVLDEDGNHVRSFGGLGDTPGSFARPKGVAVDSHGNVHVVDAAFNNVQVFDNKGRLLMAFAGLGTQAGQLWIPLGIAIDHRDRMFVADRYNNRIQVFELLAVPPEAMDEDI